MTIRYDYDSISSWENVDACTMPRGQGKLGFTKIVESL